MKKQAFRYNRSDFKPLPVRLEHLRIRLNFIDGKVHGENTLWLTARVPLSTLRLDAQELQIDSMEWVDLASGGRTARALRYDYRTRENAVIVRLPRRVAAGETFALRAVATSVPSDNVLEGIYKDTTPAGCPQQYMSQCQQWGFQRILPIFDDCTAKCTMVTTIEADARYTHLISNGNICRWTNPDGKPVPVEGDPSRQVITYENLIPMAPYLFIVCVGTWDVLEDEVVYPSGRRVKLEYLVPPGRKAGAAIPMKILKDSVLWQGRTQEYEYLRDVYRTICMEKSNFGGMENVGNTTIITEAALIDDDTDDARLEYAYGVVPHEFEHNQCGSDVTMETPFDVWLNEAFTVDVDRQFLMDQFDPDRIRLDEIDVMRAPVGGPLSVEDAGHLGNIVRQGFNHPDELIDGVTYVKAAEVIRMLRSILGVDTFRRGKNLYFRRYSGGNANTDQFFACFEEVSGRNLAQFKREWLHTIGYPVIRANWSYDPRRRRLKIVLTQKRSNRKGGLFHVPVALAAVDRSGRDIRGTRTVVEMTGARKMLEFRGVPAPAFVSFNRNVSFYGTLEDESATPDRLRDQIRLDSNGCNRVDAMRRLTDRERVKLIRDPAAAIGSDWLDTYLGVLRDHSLPVGLRGYLLRIDEQSMDRACLPFYRDRYRARIRLLRAVAQNFLPDLLSAFERIDTYRRTSDPKDGIEARALKAILLRAIVEAASPEVYRLAEEHFHRAWNITDKISALACIQHSEHPRRCEILEEAYHLWKDRLSPYLNYLRIVGAGTHDDVFDGIAREEQRDTFRIQHPGHNRSLFLPMAGNNRMLWTDAGLAWMAKTVVRLATINEYSATKLVTAFQQVYRLADDLRPKVLAALRTMADGVSASATPSVAGRIRMYLENPAAGAR